MIEIKVREAAAKVGITSGYQLDKATGFGPGMSQRIFEGDFTRIDLNTLNTLCNVLSCTPNDILRFVRDKTATVFSQPSFVDRNFCDIFMTLNVASWPKAKA